MVLLLAHDELCYLMHACWKITHIIFFSAQVCLCASVGIPECVLKPVPLYLRNLLSA